MGDLSAVQLLLVIHAYLLLALFLVGVSADSLVAKFRKHTGYFQRRFKVLLSIPLILTCLAVLASGLFIIGLSHGGKPEDYQIILFILGCLIPVVLLGVWIKGSAWVDGLWLFVVFGLFGYLLIFNPSLYVQSWADTHNDSAQLWMAENYLAGTGGLTQSESRSRVWYRRAAEGGDAEAQYRIATQQRRHSKALQWYRAAAEQGHPAAMAKMAELAQTDDQRLYWLQQAFSEDHPEALFLMAKKMMNRDLAGARELMLGAAEKGSVSGILFLRDEYTQGGFLFADDAVKAEYWSGKLSEISTKSVDAARDKGISSAPQVVKIQTFPVADGDRLYQRAQRFLAHPAKDADLYRRAVDDLEQGARLGHVDSALLLATLASNDRADVALGSEPLKWYQIAADGGSVKALEALTDHYKVSDKASEQSLQLSLQYNQSIIELLQTKNDKNRRLTLQYWKGEYRDTKKRIAQLQRLGGSWDQAFEKAKNDPDKEYLLATELLKKRQYAEGMARMESAARRGSDDARFYIAQKILRGPRSFSQEISAVSDFQALHRDGFPQASLRLASLYQSGTGIVPRNYYLSSTLLHSIESDPLLAEKTQRWLQRIPAYINRLNLDARADPIAAIEDWYRQLPRAVKSDEKVLQQYQVLLDHFKDIEITEADASENDAAAQYRLAQSLQSHDLSRAIDWLRRSAQQGFSDAQYELAVRMIRGKKNTPEQFQELKKWAHMAADSNHPGALVFLANQHRSGSAGFDKDIVIARGYYQRALDIHQGEVLYQGRIAGREIVIRRSVVEKRLQEL